MGKLFKFRGRRLRGVGEFKPSQRIRFWPEPRVTVGGVARDTLRWLGRLRPVILGAILLSLWPTLDARLVEPPAWLSAEPEPVDATFTRCGRGRGHACVVDGDTFRLGQRRIRIVGVDTPEVKAQCPEEARLAEAAAVRLQQLLNEGPFEMVGRLDDPTDRYGRELKSLRRRTGDGGYTSIAAQMREEGHARRYLGGLRGGWCG